MLIAVCGGGLAAAPASAAWSAAKVIEPGVDPIVAFGPSGAAAIGASVNSSCGGIVATHVVLHPAHGMFGRPATLGRKRGKCGDWPGLLAIALSKSGSTVALFGPIGSDEQPIDAFVRPLHASRFTAPQRLAPLGNASNDAVVPNTTTVVDTTRGEVVEAATDDAGKVSTAALAPGRTRFSVARHGPAHLTQTGDLEMATDGAGGTFLAGEGDPGGCATVAYRPVHGSFATRHRTDYCGRQKANIAMRVAAAGRGYAALLSENIDYSSRSPDQLLIQVGRYGRFGVPTQLSPALAFHGSPFGSASDRDGSVTVAWQGCTPGPIVQGVVTLHDCQVFGETGSIYTGFSGKPTLVEPNSPRTRLSGLVAEGAIAVHRCPRHQRCTIAVTLAGPDGDFGAPQQISAAGHNLLSLQGDGRGSLIIVWRDYGGALYAAVRSRSATRFGVPHRLSEAGGTGVTAGFGPAGEAIVAWSHSGHTTASLYRERG